MSDACAKDAARGFPMTTPTPPAMSDYPTVPFPSLGTAVAVHPGDGATLISASFVLPISFPL